MLQKRGISRYVERRDIRFFWFVRCLRYMLARRVCRRDPLPRRLDEICGRGPQLAWGKESAPSKAPSGFRKGERASEGRGCSVRGTLNADRKTNRKGAALFTPLHSRRQQQKPAQETQSGHSQLSKEECYGDSKQRCYRSTHLLAFSLVLRM